MDYSQVSNDPRSQQSIPAAFNLNEFQQSSITAPSFTASAPASDQTSQSQLQALAALLMKTNQQQK